MVGAQLGRLRQLLASEIEAGKKLDALATRGAIRELEARLEWLTEVRRELLPRG